MKRRLLLPWRLLVELWGYNACFFERHDWLWTSRRDFDDFGRLREPAERYQVCRRCNTINLKTWRTA